MARSARNLFRKFRVVRANEQDDADAAFHSAHHEGHAGEISAGALKRFSDVIATIPVAAYLCTLNGHIVEYNDAALQLWGCAPNGDGAPYLGFRSARDFDGGENDLSALLSAAQTSPSGFSSKMSGIFERADGQTIAATVDMKSLHNPAGFVIGAIVCLTETTRQLVQIRESNRQERYLRDVLDALPVAVYATDTEGRITFFNQAAVHFAGRVPDPDTDRWCVSWRLRTSEGEQLPIDQSSMALAVRENRPIRGLEAVAERPDGTLIPFAPLPTPIRDADDRLVGAVNMLVDLTTEHQAQKQEVTDDLGIHGGLGEALRMLQNLTRDGDGGADLLSSFGELYEHYIATMRCSTDDASCGPYVSLDLKVFLKHIFGAVLGTNAPRVQTWGSAAHLQPKAALILGMIVVELAKYSARLGAIAMPGGFVGLAWKVQALPNQNGRLVMDWQEYGGRQGRELPESSLIARLIKYGVIEALRGEAKLTYEAPGTRCRLEITI